MGIIKLHDLQKLLHLGVPVNDVNVHIMFTYSFLMVYSVCTSHCIGL